MTYSNYWIWWNISWKCAVSIFYLFFLSRFSIVAERYILKIVREQDRGVFGRHLLFESNFVVSWKYGSNLFLLSKMHKFLWFLLFRWLHLDILERLFRHDDFSSPYVSTQTLVLFFTPKNCVFYFSWVSFWYTWVSIPKHSVCRIFIGFGTDLPSCFLKPNLWKCRRLS